MIRHIPLFLGYVDFGDKGGFDGIGCVAYCPAHEHTPGSDVPCSSSWLVIY